ncbi:chondroadherin-like [Mytilus edulis]|uniref:chondroadherin-like n=1 Tax=Mytilus edulis TaxID=6550 RepID=UPI0039EE728B
MPFKRLFGSNLWLFAEETGLSKENHVLDRNTNNLNETTNDIYFVQNVSMIYYNHIHLLEITRLNCLNQIYLEQIEIYLSSNNISSIDSTSLSGLTSLKILYLSLNEISSIDDGAFADLQSLKQLFLDNNKINSIDANLLSGLTSLESLYLDNNEISSIADGAFSDLGSLSTLLLYYNRISSINAKLLSGLTSLNTLRIDFNEISSIEDGAFSGLQSLETISLSSNNMLRIEDGAFSDLPFLRYIAIHSNKLTTVSDNIFDNVTDITDLSLIDNQLICCTMADFFEWRQNQNSDLNLITDCTDFNSTTDINSFNVSKCQIVGGWRSWVNSTCSVTCGNGILYRNRICDSPIPSAGGKDCEGSSEETLECSLNKCPVDGQWGAWSTGTCSVTCGNGTRYRNRRCDSPPSSNNGQDCIGSSTVYVKCNLGVCQAQCKGSGKKQESKRMKTRKWKRYQLRQLNGKSDP